MAVSRVRFFPFRLFHLYWSVIKIIERYSSRTMPLLIRIRGFLFDDLILTCTHEVCGYMYACLNDFSC